MPILLPMIDLYRRLKKAEPYLFLGAVLMNCLPLFYKGFVPTTDGPAHLYNANLIIHLLGGNEQISDFFIFTSIPVPNWIGHIILAPFMLFLPAFIAERILMLAYIAGLAYAFRALTEKLSPGNRWGSYLILPFTYTFFLVMGFFNFCLGMVLMLLILRYWHESIEQPVSGKKMVRLGLLMVLAYFSHLFTFVMLVGLMGLAILSNGVQVAFAQKLSLKAVLAQMVLHAGRLLMVSAIPLLLWTIYMLNGPVQGNNIYLEKKELLNILTEIRPVITYVSETSRPYTVALFCLLMLLTGTTVFERIRNARAGKGYFIKSDQWLLNAGVILCLFFILPDWKGASGYMSLRLSLLFYILLIAWIAVQAFPSWLRLLALGVIAYCHFALLESNKSSLRDLSRVAVNCNKAAAYIAPNSIVLPVNYANSWLTGHYSNYLGIDKPMVILENYECGVGYFPLDWNNDAMPALRFGDKAPGELSCVNWNSNERNPQVKIGYVFMLGNANKVANSCTLQVKQVLADYYERIYDSQDCSLYKLRELK